MKTTMKTPALMVAENRAARSAEEGALQIGTNTADSASKDGVHPVLAAFMGMVRAKQAKGRAALSVERVLVEMTPEEFESIRHQLGL
jgi:hypothetical protein